MADTRPNILYLMPDQLRWDFVGAYGKAHAKTTHVDRLAARGMVFERCLSPSPVCIPARASMLTGHNAFSTGVLTNNHWLRPDHDACGMPTFARLLSSSGYHTEAIGKMHFIPWDIDEGFDHRVIAEDKRHIHIRDDYHDHLAARGLKKPGGADEPGYVEGRMASIGIVPVQHQVDAWVGQQSVAFLERHPGDTPFLLWTAFPGPHDPYNPPAELLPDVADAQPAAWNETPESAVFRPGIVAAHLKGSAGVDISDMSPALIARIRRHYQGLVKLIDDQVGDILAALAARRDGRPTLVLFASDHGDFLGDFGFLGKTLFFEPSMHVPMIVAGNAVPKGRCDAPVSLSDVFATILAAAGIIAPCQDSHILPGIGLGTALREFVMGATDQGYMIADARWKLARYRNGICSLYDVATDPGEQVNLWTEPQHSKRREDMDRRLQAWVIESVLDGHGDKTYPYMTMSPDHPGHERGWRRSYPANPWYEDIPKGVQ